MVLVLSTLSHGVLYLYQVFSTYLIEFQRADASMVANVDGRTHVWTENRIPISRHA